MRFIGVKAFSRRPERPPARKMRHRVSGIFEAAGNGRRLGKCGVLTYLVFSRRPERPKALESRALGLFFCAIGDEIAEDAGCPANAAAAVDQMEKIARASGGSKLADHHHIIIARQSGA